MTTTDWVMIAGIGPAGIVGAWFTVFRIWRRHEDVSSGVTWATGEASAKGLNAFMLPGTIMVTILWLFAVVYVPGASQDRGPAWLGGVATGLASLAVGFTLLAFWVWLFMRPKFLIPPHLRSQPGWLTAVWQARRGD